MAKPDWGTKRMCFSCGARFFDLRRVPIVCPVCNAVYDPDRQPRSKRGGGAAKEAVGNVRTAAVSEAANVKDKRRDAKVDTEADGLIDTVDVEEGSDAGDIEDVVSDEDDLIEDTSDLGEDDDDLGEVMEHLDDGLEDKN